MKRIKAKGIPVIVYERPLKDGEFLNSKIIIDLAQFKQQADFIIANHNAKALADLANKFYNRVLFRGSS